MKGCLLRISFLPVLVLLGIALFSFRLSGQWLDAFEQGTPIAGILTGILAWFIWMSYLDIRRYKKYRLQLRHPVFQPGKPFVVSGRIESEETHLSAPFSGEKCLGYHYEINHYTKMGTSSTRWIDYEGYALLPSVIKSNLGNFRILGNPDPGFFISLKTKTIVDALEKAKDYIARTNFTETIDQPGSYIIDKRIGADIDLAEKRCDFVEKTIVPEEEYLLSGVYSTNPYGIAPHPDTILEPFKIIPGGERGILKIIRNRRIGIGICCTLISVITLVHFVAVG